MFIKEAHLVFNMLNTCIKLRFLVRSLSLGPLPVVNFKLPARLVCQRSSATPLSSLLFVTFIPVHLTFWKIKNFAKLFFIWYKVGHNILWNHHRISFTKDIWTIFERQRDILYFLHKFPQRHFYCLHYLFSFPHTIITSWH